MGAIKAKKRQKMCYNCEGEVDLDVIVCPFCAADLRAERPDQVKGAYSPSIHSLKSLGSGGAAVQPTIEEMAEAATSRLAEEEHPFPNSPMSGQAAPEATSEEDSWLKGIVPIAGLSLGAMFVVLGVLLLLFSEDGALILKWDATWWFVYLIVGGAAGFFSWKKI